jgi:hypothetical protein
MCVGDQRLREERPHALEQPSGRRIPAEDEELQLTGRCRGAGLQECTDEAGSDAVALALVGDHDPELDRVAIRRRDRQGVTHDLLSA